MLEKISTLEMRERLGDLLNRVALRHDEFIIERKGKPLAAMVSVEKLAQFERLARSKLQATLAERKEVLSEEEADDLANQAKHRSRKQRGK